MPAADLAGARIGTVLSFSCAGMALAPGSPFGFGSNLVRTGAARCVFGAVGLVSLRRMHDLIDVAAWAVTRRFANRSGFVSHGPGTPR